MVWYGLVWCCMVCYGMVWYGMMKYGVVCMVGVDHGEMCGCWCGRVRYVWYSPVPDMER